MKIYIQQISINTLLKNPINFEKEYDNYLIVNKKWFNKLSKIFENDNIFDDEKITITIRNISKPNNDEQKFIQRKKLLEKEDLFKLDLQFENKLKIYYPKDFILIEEDSLKELKLDLNYDMNNKYTMLFGDNYLFIRDKNDNKNIFACSKDNYFFSVNILFKYNEEEYFKEEIICYVHNRGGLNYYLEKGNYKEDNSPQNITNSDGDFYGQILILKKIRNKEINLKYFNSCLCSLILSLVNIEKFNDAIINFEELDNNTIINLLLDFRNSYNGDLIEELQNKIDNKKTDNSNNNNFAFIIDYILTELHKELIKEKKPISPIEDYDEKQAYKRFEEKYLKNNYFKTKNKFFGIKEIIRYNECCSLKRYSFEIIKYIFINSEILQKNIDLNDCVKEWEKEVIKEKKKCDMCLIENNSLVTTKIYENPGILIIILDDIDIEFRINIGDQLYINKCKYNLINCITNKDYNNLIYKYQKWFILDKQLNFLREIDNEEIESLLKYPKVLFYEKDADEDEVKKSILKDSGFFTEIFLDNEDRNDSILNQNNDKNNYNKNINENENIINLTKSNNSINNNNNFINNNDLNNNTFNPSNLFNFLNCINMNNMNNMNNLNNLNNMNNMNNMNKNSSSNPIQQNINNNNLNAMNKKSNANNNINKNGNNLIYIKFIYKENNGFINIYENQIFNDAIEILNRKYKWIKPIDNKKFYLDEAKSKEIKKESTIFSLHLENKPSIYIK